jgi:hypothetical protein
MNLKLNYDLGIQYEIIAANIIIIYSRGTEYFRSFDKTIIFNSILLLNKIVGFCIKIIAIIIA